MKKVLNSIEIYENLPINSLANKTKEWVINHCRPYDLSLQTEWNETHNFSIYRDERYFYNTIFSYLCISKLHLLEVFNYFTYEKLKDMTAYDYYNGIGLTTIDMANVFKKVVFFNDCENQTEILNALSTIYNINNLERDINKSKLNCDIFFSLQEIEHYFNPVEHIKDLLELAKNSQYFVLSHGFTNDIYCGHYTYYNIKDIGLVHHTQIFGYIEHEILKEFSLEFCADKGKLRIYKRK